MLLQGQGTENKKDKRPSAARAIDLRAAMTLFCASVRQLNIGHTFGNALFSQVIVLAARRALKSMASAREKSRMRAAKKAKTKAFLSKAKSDRKCARFKLRRVIAAQSTFLSFCIAYKSERDVTCSVLTCYLLEARGRIITRGDKMFFFPLLSLSASGHLSSALTICFACKVFDSHIAHRANK